LDEEGLVEYVSILASSPRGAGTEGERRGADIVETTLKSFGYGVSREEFSTLPTFSYPYILVFGLVIFGALLAFASAAAGLVVAAVGFFLLLLEEELYCPVVTDVIRPLFGPRSSNVVGTLGKGSRNLIMMAHYDSTKAAYSFNPKRVGTLRGTTVADFWGGALVTTLLVLALALPLLRYIALVATIPLWLSVIVLVHREVAHGYVPGANDNASGVAVLLAVAERLAASPIEDATCYVVATGSEESGMIGAYDFFGRHRKEASSGITVNIDNPGIGEVCLVTCEGVALRHCCERGFASSASRAAGELGVGTRQYRLLPTDATPAMRRGWRAVSVMAFTGKGIGNYHWYTDTADHIDGKNLVKAADLVERIIRNELQPGQK
jgi:hypothetical protein